MEKHNGHPGHADDDPADAEPARAESSIPLKDPVCAMTVTAESPHVQQHEGKPVYFCSAG